MAEDANPAVKAPSQLAAAAPMARRTDAIRATRDRMAGNLDALEDKVRMAVGIRDGDQSHSPGARRAVTAVSVVAEARRLWRLPFWRLTAIGVVAVGLVMFGAWRSRRPGAAPSGSER